MFQLKVTDDKGATALDTVSVLVNPQTTADKIAPSVPTNLKVVYVTRTSINLDWEKSTDNVAVVRYDIYENGVKKYSTPDTEFEVTNLNAGSIYRYTVKAVDQAGNVSASSNQATGITLLIGLEYRYYEGEWTSLPNFNDLTPVKKGVTADVNLDVRRSGVNNNFGIVWEGFIKINKPGTYTFETISDDGSKFYFNSAYLPNATALVNNDGLHTEKSVSASVYVASAGVYPIAVSFFERTGEGTMKLYWKGPGISRQLVPATAFSDIASYVYNKNDNYNYGNDNYDNNYNDNNYRNRMAGGSDLTPQVTNVESGSISLDASNSGVLISKAYPSPFSNEVKLEFTNKVNDGKVTVDVYDLNGKMVHNQNFGNVPAGKSTLNVDLRNKQLADGIYMLRLHINGKPSMLIKLIRASK
jgi:hypothetical protein